MKDIPHQHLGELEFCWDRFCTRVSTTEQAAAALGGGLLGGIAGMILGRNPDDAITGAVVGAVLGALFAGINSEGAPS